MPISKASSNAVAPAVKGDLVVGTTTNDSGILGVGNNGDTLVADSAATTGLRWQGNFAAGKNKIINGDMSVWQRGTSFTNGEFTSDRWRVQFGSGTLTTSRSTDVPSGFTYSSLVTVTSAGTRNAADYFIVSQLIEGFNSASLKQGASGALSYTISFWVKSSMTGSFSGVAASGDNTRSYGFTYTISAANTWERKTITITGDTSGGATAYPVDTSTGLRLKFDLGSGSNYQTTADTWAANNNRAGVSGTVSFAQTSSATWQITGIQLEAGSVATAFQTATGTIQGELAACKRYYQVFTTGGNAAFIGQAYGTAAAFCTPSFQVEMRVAPTITLAAAGSGAGQMSFLNSAGGIPGTIGTFSADFISKFVFRLVGQNFTSAFVAGNAAALWGDSADVYRASAEL